jgi:hypothetical protein
MISCGASSSAARNAARTRANSGNDAAAVITAPSRQSVMPVVRSTIEGRSSSVDVTMPVAEGNSQPTSTCFGSSLRRCSRCASTAFEPTARGAQQVAVADQAQGGVERSSHAAAREADGERARCLCGERAREQQEIRR